MNMKELEAKVLELGAVINAQAEAIANLTGRVDRVVEGFQAKIDENREFITTTRTDHDNLAIEVAGVVTKLEEVTAKVEGRNKSAAVKRNMTDADARRVLDGDLGDIGHKEAAEQIGLTYAQVYSCRMLHTFKHVHKVLDGIKWKNPWVK